MTTKQDSEPARIKAIETRYNGVIFRSRLEARWAFFFDSIGASWQYEPEGYQFGKDMYLPDFKLHNVSAKDTADGIFCEIKPSCPDYKYHGMLDRFVVATGTPLLLLCSEFITNFDDLHILIGIRQFPLSEEDRREYGHTCDSLPIAVSDIPAGFTKCLVCGHIQVELINYPDPPCRRCSEPVECLFDQELADANAKRFYNPKGGASAL